MEAFFLEFWCFLWCQKGVQAAAPRNRLLGPIFLIIWSVWAFLGDSLLEPCWEGARLCRSKTGKNFCIFPFSWPSFAVFCILEVILAPLTPRPQFFNSLRPVFWCNFAIIALSFLSLLASKHPSWGWRNARSVPPPTGLRARLVFRFFSDLGFLFLAEFLQS